MKLYQYSEPQLIKLWNPCYEVFLAYQNDKFFGIPTKNPDALIDSKYILFEMVAHKNIGYRNDIISLKSIAANKFVFISKTGTLKLSSSVSNSAEVSDYSFDFLKRVTVHKGQGYWRIQLKHIDYNYYLDFLGSDVFVGSLHGDSTVFYVIPCSE